MKRRLRKVKADPNVAAGLPGADSRPICVDGFRVQGSEGRGNGLGSDRRDVSGWLYHATIVEPAEPLEGRVFYVLLAGSPSTKADDLGLDEPFVVAVRAVMADAHSTDQT